MSGAIAAGALAGAYAGIGGAGILAGGALGALGGAALKSMAPKAPKAQAPAAPPTPPQAAKVPDEQVRRATAAAATGMGGGQPSTMLTGANGVGAGSLNLGKNTLLGA